MFRGSFAALITPFRNGKVDEKAFQSFVEWQVAEGTHGFVPCGTTGESPTLTHAEHKRVVELCIEVAGGKRPIMAGTGSNSTDEAIELTQHAKKAGADAALVVTPYYNKPTQAGLYAHYKAIAEAVDIPIVIYNIPGRCVVDVSVETMAALAKIRNIIGVKEATGDVTRITKHRIAIGEKFCQLSGDDALSFGQIVHGASGVISVTANVAPRQVAAFNEAALAGDVIKARELHDRLQPLHEALMTETNPGPVKYAASLLGRCQGDMRLPMVEISKASQERVVSAMKSAGLLN